LSKVLWSGGFRRYNLVRDEQVQERVIDVLGRELRRDTLFMSPDEVRSPDKASIALVGLAGGQVGQYTFRPGWRWSECIKPIVKTDTCQVDHIGYVVSGRLGVRHEDGTEVEVGPGSVYRIAPGHDGWTIGSEPVVVVEFQGAKTFAKA